MLLEPVCVCDGGNLNRLGWMEMRDQCSCLGDRVVVHAAWPEPPGGNDSHCLVSGVF